MKNRNVRPEWAANNVPCSRCGRDAYEADTCPETLGRHVSVYDAQAGRE